jgi:xanthine dehydrogenase iron-sulfur cluster and FAD-binding subunit A
MWEIYCAPRTVPEALELLASHSDDCRIIAGGTDILLELERGIGRQAKVLVDITRIPGLDRIERRDGLLRVGALATHNQVVASADVVAHAFPLARACWMVGAPQIRNRGTVAGNLVTASPANDTITPLWAMDATVTLASQARGERTLSFDQFFLGVRRTAIAPDEMIISINVPMLNPAPGERGTFLKLGLRQAQAISVANVAAVIAFAGPAKADAEVETPPRRARDLRQGGQVCRARIALGSVAPTIVRAPAAEAYLVGRVLTEDVISRAAELVAEAARPISDIRGSAEYRSDMVRVMTARALRQLSDGTERAGWPERPVLLWGGAQHGQRVAAPPPSAAASDAEYRGPETGGGQAGALKHVLRAEDGAPIKFVLNGRPTSIEGARGKTLLRALREDAGLTGTKEGCAEGECGACTVWLDGMAVMSCLVPAERADGCEVVTIEGLVELIPERGEGEQEERGGQGARFHPLQQAFVDAGAVQCGYCTPGILMSAANLLEEVAHPTQAQIREALTGNLCRCTGYYRIVDAIEQAAG